MPKINLPELEALREYLTGKVPRYGMFSTLKGLIDNSPRDTMTAQEWAGYLKPGQVAVRQGVEFPLKKEELDYSKIGPYLAGLKPNEKVSRDMISSLYMKNAPNLNVRLGSDQASLGMTREQQLLQRAGVPNANNRVTGTSSLHPSYSHAERGDSPDNSKSPWNTRQYQEDVTTSPDFGSFSSHFSPQDISWNRTNRLPLWGESIGMGPDSKTPEGRTMRVIDEIQSDRHQKAIKPGGGWHPTPESLTRMQDLATDILHNPPPDAGVNRDNLVSWLRYGLQDDHPLTQDPRWQELQQLREAAKSKTGYRDATSQARLNQIESDPLYADPEGAARTSQRITVDQQGNWQSQTDPEVQRRINALRLEAARIKSQVPDTPFKKTQGYVGLEMRKALTDALHSGDTHLGLASGNDQNAFYQRRFNEDQQGGQNYAYNVSYPSVLKDLARQMGLKYGPVDVTLQAERKIPPKMWPPYQMRRAFENYPDFGGGENPHTMENFVSSVLSSRDTNPSRNPHYLVEAVTDLFHEMWDKLPEETRMSLLAPSVHPETGAPESIEERFGRAVNEAQSRGKELYDIQRPIRQHVEDRWGDPQEDEEGNAVETQQWQDMVRSRNYQNATFNFQQALKEAASQVEPVLGAYRAQFEKPPAQVDQGLRKKTFQNAIDFSDPDEAARVKAAGVPVWKTGGQVDHVKAAVHRMSFGGGGKVSMVEHITQLIGDYINKLHEVSRVPPEQLTDQHLSDVRDFQQRLMDHGIDPEALENQVMQQAGPRPQDTIHAEGGSIEEPDDSSLTTISKTLGKTPIIGPDLQRVGTRAAQQFYGLDKKGKVVAGGRAWTEKQGGTPMALLDEAAAAPGSIAGLVNTLKNAVYGSTIPGIHENPEVESLIHSLTDLPQPQWSKDASERLGMLEDRIGSNTGVGTPHGWRENAEDMAGNLLTPVPMTGALKDANAARRAMEFMIPVRPPLRRLPVDAGVLGGINTASQALTGEEEPVHHGDLWQPEELNRAVSYYDHMADGGQPEQPPQPETPTEDSLLNDMLQRRILMRQSSPPLPINLPPMQSAEGGKVGLAEQLMQLVAKLTGGSGGERLEARVQPPAPATSPSVSASAAVDPAQSAHAAEIARRNWSAGVNPDDIFNRVIEKSPSYADTAKEIQSRNWTDVPTLGNHSGFPTGGRVEGNVDPSSADWHDIRRRLAILQNPVIQGKPPSVIPPLPKAVSSEDAVNAVQRQQALDSFNRMMGHDMAEPSNIEQEQLGPLHFSSQDTELLDLLKAKLLGQQLSHEAGKGFGRTTNEDMKIMQETPADQTMAEGGKVGRRGFLLGLTALLGGAGAKMSGEKLAELEKTILGTPKEESNMPHPYAGGDGPVESTIEGSHRRYIPVITERADSPITLQDTGLNFGKILKSDYLGSNGPHHMHRVLVEAPADELLDHHLATVDGDLELAHGVNLKGSHTPEGLPGWERWSEQAGPESHPVHQALQGAKDEIFGAGDNPINWERVGHHLDAIPDSPMKQSLDAELENLRDLEMSGEELDSSAISAHQALDDLAAEHGIPIARHPNP